MDSVSILSKKDLKSQLKDCLKSCQVVCIFAETDLSYVPLLKKWLLQDRERFVIWVETDQTRFLEMKQSDFGQLPQVRSCLFNEQNQELLKALSWEFVFLQWGYFFLDEDLRDQGNSFFTQLQTTQLHVHLMASEFKDQAELSIENLMGNFSLLQRSKLGSELEGGLKGKTAVVCGAGKSLESFLPQLFELEDRAVIIAGGSSVTALNQAGITPHLIAGVDPSPSLTRALSQASFDVPFFYQSRFSHRCLQLMQGPLVWFPGAHHLPLEAYLLSQASIFTEPFDAGWSVANFCTALSLYLGCTRVIFAGLDFCTQNNKVYAQDLPVDSCEAPLLPIEGGGYARRGWVLSQSWLEDYRKAHPEIEWRMGSSLQGNDWGLERIEERELLELPSSDIRAEVYRLIEEAPLAPIDPAKTSQVQQAISHSAQKALRLCDQLISLCQKYYPDSAFEKGGFLVLEHDFEQELYYEQCLLPLWQVWQFPLLRQESHPLARKLHRLLFFKQVLEKHLSHLRTFSYAAV